MAPMLIATQRFYDERGSFAEIYNARKLEIIGIRSEFVQDNHSSSNLIGTVRGLHFQAPPSAQAKLVRVLRGRILDVAIDIRRNSPTYGRYVSAELSAEEGQQIYIPVGYAHGFATLEPETEVVYKVTDYYDEEREGGVRWDDPAIAIDWRVPPAKVVLSAKDATLPLLQDLDTPFTYDGTPMQLRRIGKYSTWL